MEIELHSAEKGVEQAAHDALPQHLAPLIGREWAVWRSFVLRGTGFPVKHLLQLSDPDCASCTDRLVLAQNLVETRLQAAVASLNQVLDRLGPQRDGCDHDRFAEILGTLRCVRERKFSRIKLTNGDCQQEIGVLLHAIEEERRLESEFLSVFLQSLERQSRVLREVASDPAFQEAIIWQNRGAFATAILPLLESASSRTTRSKKHRQHEELAANYLQRYCAKNETIGFFGPVAWGTIGSGCSALTLTPGSSLVKRRRTYFEDWAVDALAEHLSRIPEMRWWTPPCLAPYFHVEDGKLCSSRRAPVPLDELAQIVLPLCNGERLPNDILCLLQQKPSFADVGRSCLSDLLDQMANDHVVVWRFTVPIEANAESNLRGQLLRVQDASLQGAGLALLDRLEEARGKVAAAAGSPDSLNSALRDMEQTFEQLTNVPAHRRAGATYAGRTLVYEDCQRDLTIEASPKLLSPILPALSVLLRAVQWFVRTSADAFKSLLWQAYNELVETHNCREIPAAALALRCGLALPRAPSIQQVEQAFRTKWADVFFLPPGRSQVRFSSSKLKADVDRLFPDPAPVDPIRYYCPDFMIEAKDVDAIARGEALYVLSELHVGTNTLTSVLFVQQHPHPESLVAATMWDCLPRAFKILGSRSKDRQTARTGEGVFCSIDYILAANGEAVAPTGFASHPISELVATEQNGQLLVNSRDGKHSFDILEAYAEILVSYLMHKACWIQSSSHTPRLLIDQLVVQREMWRVSVDDLSFAFEKEEALRFLGARKWRQGIGVPEILFVKTPIETKPFYVDLSAPVYVEIFCKMIRRLAAASGAGRELTLSEVLPSPSSAWVRDGAGALYVSELRFAFLDLKSRARQNLQKEAVASDGSSRLA